MKLFTVILSLVLLPMVAWAAETASEARLAEVVLRGSHVMPFDLEQTTHVFFKNQEGGLQQVIVKDPANDSQIRLIRQHLAKIAAEFLRGDFSNPVKIHGEAMPGLAALTAAHPGQLKIVYRELNNGAEISYSSATPELIDAIHQWFDAQLSDHARHAVDVPQHHGHH